MIWKIIINIIRQALSMIFMYFLLLYEKEKKNSFALIGALCYGTPKLFFTMSLSFDFMNDCFVWLPLTFLAFRYYEREKKILTFVAAIAITIANNFYFAFINCVAYGVYFLWFSYDKGMSIKQYFIKIIKIVLMCIFGLCIASVFFLPSVRTFVMLDRTAAVGNLSIIPEIKILYNFYQNFISLNSNLTIPLFIILIIYSLKGIDKNSLFFRKLVFMVFWVVMMLIPFFSSMMNGFSYNTPRWNYIIVFAAAYLIPDLLEEVCEKKRLGFIKMMILYAISIILAIIYRIGEGAEVFTKQEVINLAVNLYILRIIGQHSRITKKAKRTFRGYFVVVLLFILSMLRVYSYQPPRLSDDASKKRTEDFLFGDNTTKYVIKELNQNPYAFFRVSDETSTSYYDNNYGRYENMSLNNGIYGVTTYNSMVNGDLSNWLKRVYNIRGLFTSSSYYRGFDNRYLLETAWGVKYKINYNSEDYPDIPLGYSISPINIENKYRNVLVNDYDVGIDLWYDSVIDTKDLDQMDFAYKDAYICRQPLLTIQKMIILKRK